MAFDHGFYDRKKENSFHLRHILRNLTMYRVQACQPSPGTHTLGATSGKRLAVKMKSQNRAAAKVGTPPLSSPQGMSPEVHTHSQAHGCTASARPHPSAESGRVRHVTKTSGRRASEVGIGCSAFVDHHKHFLRDYQPLITSKNPQPS